MEAGAPFACNNKPGFPVGKCPLVLCKKCPHHKQGAVPLLWQRQAQSNVFTALIGRIHDLLSYANSPEKPGNMVDILKWFSFVIGKSPREMITYF